MNYQVGEIYIQIHPSSSLWTERAKLAMDRQLDGFQTNDTGSSARYQLNVYDYNLLPVKEEEANSVIPGYSYASGNIYVDRQQNLAIALEENTLNLWCSMGCRKVSIPFLLQQLFLQERKTFVHAAGIAMAGSGILLPAFGGIGKTAFIASASKVPGVKIYGDDLVLVGEKGEMEPYLRPFALYNYHRTLFPTYFADQNLIFKPLTLSWRIFNKARTSLGELVGRNWKQPKHIIRTGYIPVSPRRVLPAEKLAQTSVPLDRIILLKRSAILKEIRLDDLDPNDAVNFMVNVLQHEWHGQVRFLLAWQTHRSQPYHSYIDQIDSIVRSTVASAQSIHLLQIPMHLPISEVGQEILRHVLPK